MLKITMDAAAAAAGRVVFYRAAAAVLTALLLIGIGLPAHAKATNPGPMSIGVLPTHIPVGALATVTATLTGVANVSCGATTIQYEIWTDTTKTTLASAWTALSTGVPVSSVYSAAFEPR